MTAFAAFRKVYERLYYGAFVDADREKFLTKPRFYLEGQIPHLARETGAVRIEIPEHLKFLKRYIDLIGLEVENSYKKPKILSKIFNYVETPRGIMIALYRDRNFIVCVDRENKVRKFLMNFVKSQKPVYDLYTVTNIYEKKLTVFGMVRPYIDKCVIEYNGTSLLCTFKDNYLQLYSIIEIEHWFDVYGNPVNFTEISEIECLYGDNSLYCSTCDNYGADFCPKKPF